ADSPGMLLGKKHGVELAPFFIVRDDAGKETVYTSTLRFVKEGLGQSATAEPRGASGPALTTDDVGELSRGFAGKVPIEIVRWALQRFGSDCAIAFSGAEDVVLIDMAAKSGLPFSVFSLDTGRLHADTYQFIDRVRSHYGIEIALMWPDPARLEPFVR